MAESQVLPAGWVALAFNDIDSTNSEAMRRAAAGERGPLWITARSQNRGRGRSGRNWSTDAGNVAATLLFAPGCEISTLPQLSIVAGVAAHDVIAAALPREVRSRLRIKWPNDILIGEAKVCGILVESTVVGRDALAVIGTGINARSEPGLQDRRTTSIGTHAGAADAARLADALAGALSQWISVWDTGRGFAAIRSAWLERGLALGSAMTVNAGAERMAGSFAGLSVDGALLLEDASGERRSFAFGDVALGVVKV